MKPKSAIEKGKRFEKFIAHEIELAGFGLAKREDGSGSGKRKGDIACNLDFLIEAKNHKKLNWWQSIDQSKSQAEIGNFNPDKWMLVVRDPRTPEDNPGVYAMIDFWQMLELLKRSKEPKIKKPDRETAYTIRNLIIWLKKLEKTLIK